MTIGLVIFMAIATIAIASALGLLISRNAIYAALFLIINFVSISLLYFILGAPFIALAQITIYAGSIMVLFLFVIMLLGSEKLPRTMSLPWQKPAAIVLSILLIMESAILIVQQAFKPFSWPDFLPGNTSPQEIGMALFSQYLLPFELTSIILLAAVVGAIYLTRPERIRRRIANEKKEG